MSSHSNGPSVDDGGDGGGWMYSAGLVFFALLLVICFFKNKISQHNERKAAELTQQEAVRVAPAPPPVRLVASMKRFSTLPTVQYLRQGWRDYPVDGAIIIVMPGGRELRDALGEDHDWGFQPDGWYEIKADPAKPGATKADFYNRWEER